MKAWGAAAAAMSRTLPSGYAMMHVAPCVPSCLLPQAHARNETVVDVIVSVGPVQSRSGLVGG